MLILALLVSGDEGERRYRMALTGRGKWCAWRCGLIAAFVLPRAILFLKKTRAGLLCDAPESLKFLRHVGAAEAVGRNTGCWRHVAAVHWISGQAW